MSAFIDAYAALLKTQVALMKVGIATRRPFIFVPVADDGEFTRLKAVLGISAPPPAASLPNAAPVASDGTEGQAASSEAPGPATTPAAANQTAPLFKMSQPGFAKPGGQGDEWPCRVDLASKKLPVIRVNNLRAVRPFYVRVPTDGIAVPKKLTEHLNEFLDKLKKHLGKKELANKIYWSAGIRTRSKEMRIDLQIDVDVNINVDVFPQKLTSIFEDFIKNPISIGIGMPATTINDDHWANLEHDKIRPAHSIAADDGRCTFTAIVRSVDVSTGKRLGITVGHGVVPGYHRAQKASPPRQVYVNQPSANRNVDRIVGHVFGGCYTPIHNSEIEFDVGLIELEGGRVGPNSFGTDGLIINSVGAPPEEGQEVAFHGASSGFREVQVRRTDVAAEIKAKDEQGNAIRLYMAGLIEVVARESKDRKKPVAQAGDSGAPLVSEVGGNYSLVGYLVASGLNRSDRRHPRTFAAPADILFDALRIELA